MAWRTVRVAVVAAIVTAAMAGGPTPDASPGGLALPLDAAAGGFSTVSLDTPPPEEIEPGEAWQVRFTVLSHGRTPLPGLRPAVRIEAVDGPGSRSFPARSTTAPGTYRVRVVFPAAGRWRVEAVEHPALSVPTGHSFGEVSVVGPGAGPPAAVAAGALGLLAGALAWLARLALARPRSAPDDGGARLSDAVQ